MKAFQVLRLLLDVFGALFLGMIIVAPLAFGVLPYEGLRRLGTITFYGLLVAALIAWAWLAARSLSSSPRHGSRAPGATD